MVQSYKLLYNIYATQKQCN